ncbi:MAG: energy transducer TonB [Candidatus Eremiobacteraeota bacterium]|nr:energy transducer TonB [Candidatus Eremiobacteraeota bacterium]
MIEEMPMITVGLLLFGLSLMQATTPTPLPCGCQADADVVKPAIPRPENFPVCCAPLYATVAVLVGPDGKVEKTSIYKSSGDLSFDMASIRAARESTYKAKIVDCHPVEGIVYFKTLIVAGTPPPQALAATPTPSCPPTVALQSNDIDTAATS